MNNVVIKSIILNELKKCQFNRFYNFKFQWIFFKMQKTFIANFKHSFFFKFKHYKDFKSHLYEKNFWNFMTQQIKQHKQDFNFWMIIDHWKFNEHQMLKCQWMFKYKTNKHDKLLKYKAKIIMYDNQQHWLKLFTQVIILTIIVLWILLTFIIRFNLKILQFDVINIFVYVFLNKVIFMQMFFKYEKQKKILWLNKTLYDLKWLFFLWQWKFTNVFATIRIHRNFSKIMHCCSSWNHHFFFVDDCVIVFFENKWNKIMIITNELIKKFIINIINEFK